MSIYISAIHASRCCFGGRGRTSIIPTDVTYSLPSDHDFEYVSFTRSVTLDVEVNDGMEEDERLASFYGASDPLPHPPPLVPPPPPPLLVF